MPDRPIKVLIAKPGLDGHDRGAKVLARGLRDEGFEVVYTGLRQTPEMVATAALQEDVDVVGLSILSGAHMTLVPRITKLLEDAAWTTSSSRSAGSSPTTTCQPLKEAGVAAVFGPGTTIAPGRRVPARQRADRATRVGESADCPTPRSRGRRRWPTRPSRATGWRWPALLTAVENRTPLAEAALRRLYPLAGRAHLVGITGPPGVGQVDAGRRR